jgi:hypothetical protein
VRKASATNVGDRVDAEVRFDSDYRNGPLQPAPSWFTIALRGTPAALRNWKALIPSRKKEVVRHLARLKSAEARARNLHTAWYNYGVTAQAAKATPFAAGTEGFVRKSAAGDFCQVDDGPGRIRTFDQGIHSAPMFPSGVDYLITRMIVRSREGAGGSSLLSRALKPSGSLCTFRRCTAGSAQGCHERSLEGFPEFFPFTSRVSTRRHRFDESPALTAVLQAQ